jgi:hypothetical protein
MSWILAKNPNPFKLKTSIPKIKPIQSIKPIKPIKPIRPIKPIAPIGFHYRWKDDK